MSKSDIDSPSPTIFKYEKPELKRSRGAVVLARSERILAAVQIVRKGGENNLHSHEYLDGLWFVLNGRVAFYTTGDELIAELGPSEGILIPHGYPYWFESCSEVELEIMQIEGSTKPVQDLKGFAEGRTNHSARSREFEEAEAEFHTTQT